MTDEEMAEEWVNKEYDNSYYPDCNYSAKRDAENAQLKAFRRDCIKLTEDNAVIAWCEIPKYTEE